jgi:hypothetical protein
MLKTVCKTLHQSKESNLEPTHSQLDGKYAFYVLLIISLFFSLFISSKGYGFGVDFYASYRAENVSQGGITDLLGWKLATLTIFNTHIGVFVVTFIISISTGLLFFKTTYIYFSDKYKWLFYLYFIALLHTWPIIMSTSNVMRQGVAMSFLFLSVYHSLSSSASWKVVLFIILASFSHKSGLIFTLLLLLQYVYYFILTRFNKWVSTGVGSLFFLGAVSFILLYLSLNTYSNNDTGKIIGGDFSRFFIFINIGYIFIYMMYLKNKNNLLDRFLFISSFTLPVFFIYDYIWQYERLNMIILILYMFSLPKIFIFPQRILISFLLICIVVIMTIYTGMFQALK